MTLDEVIAHIDRVDRTLRSSKPVPDADKVLSLRMVYSEESWGGPQATVLPPEALAALKFEEMTADARWAKCFNNNVRQLAVYRSRVGWYWLLTYDAVTRDHVLEHVGTAGDVVARFK